MRKAIVLGSRPGSGNIGAAIASELQGTGRWETIEHDCHAEWAGDDEPAFEIPTFAGREGWQEADTLIVTLGRTSVEPFVRTSEEEIDQTIYGCLNLPIHAALEFTRAREFAPATVNRYDTVGTIILVGSYAYRHPFTNGVAYCAAKAGLDLAAKTMAWELTPAGFAVLVVHPYHVEGTPMWEQVQQGVMKTRNWDRMEADEYAEANVKHPAGMMTPEEVASTVRMLAESSDRLRLSGTNVEMFGGTR